MHDTHSKGSNDHHRYVQISVLHRRLSFLLHLASQNIVELVNIEWEGGAQRTRPTVIVDFKPLFLIPKTII